MNKFVAIATLIGLLALGGAVTFLMDSPVYAEPQGKDLFIKFKCNGCHTINSLGIKKIELKDEEKDNEEEETPEDKNKKPKDLSDAGKKHDAAWISKWLMKKEKIKDKKTKKMVKHKKKFKGTEEELTALSAWLATFK